MQVETTNSFSVSGEESVPSLGSILTVVSRVLETFGFDCSDASGCSSECESRWKASLFQRNKISVLRAVCVRIVKGKKRRPSAARSETRSRNESNERTALEGIVT